MRNKKPAKGNNVHDKSRPNEEDQNIDFMSQLDFDTYIIDDLDQRLLELLIKGYENKQISVEVKTPLSTVQRRIRKIFESQYISRKNELNHKNLGLRKGYLQISLKGGNSYGVAQKLAGTSGIISVSEVTGNDFDILCICIFKNTEELFSLIENIKTIERINKVAWAEEVRSLPTEVEKIAAAFGSRSINNKLNGHRIFEAEES